MPEAAGIAYSYNDGGVSSEETPPLLLIHGSGGDRLHWAPQLRRRKELRVYGLDLPGHGKAPGDGERSILAYVRHIIRWMDELAIAKAIWCGHSMGGAISITAALKFPQRVAGLILVGTGARLRVSPDILEMTANPDRSDEAADLIARWAFSPSASPRLMELGRDRYGSARPAVMHFDFKACDEFDVMEQLEAIRAPTLIICGEDDRLTPVKYSRYLLDHIPGSEMRIVPDAGHMVMLEKSDEVSDEIMRFIRSAY